MCRASVAIVVMGRGPPVRCLHPRLRGPVVQSAAVLGSVFIAVLAWIVLPALPSSGNDGIPARIAESARDKGAAVLAFSRGPPCADSRSECPGDH